MSLVFPTDPGDVDRDGDGLIDLEVRFDGEVDLSTVTLTSVGPVRSRASVENLLEAWQVARLDGQALIVEEVDTHLLRRGPGRLVVSARSTGGTEAVLEIPVRLPPAALHSDITIPTPEGETRSFQAMEVADDPDRVFVATQITGGPGASLAIVDGRSREVIATQAVPVREPLSIVFNPSTDRIFIADFSPPSEGLVVASGTDGVLVDQIPLTQFGGRRDADLFLDGPRNQIVVLPRGGHLIFANDSPVTFINVIDPVAQRQARIEFMHYAPGWSVNVAFQSLVIDPATGSFFIGTTGFNEPQGIAVINRGGLFLHPRFIDVDPDGPSLGWTRDMELAGTSIIGINQATDATGRIFRISLPSGNVTFGELGRVTPLDIAVSPEIGEYFVLAGRTDGEITRILQLVDAVSLRPIWESETSDPEVVYWHASFRSDGNVVFVSGSPNLPGRGRVSLLTLLRR